MIGDFGKNRGERTDTKDGMIGDCDVVLAVLRRRKAYMTAGLACDLIAELSKSFDEIRTGEVPRQPHAAIVSSLTKCRRMILGV
jgi:hypothetical protein